MTDKGLINVMIKNVVGHRAVRTREKGNNATLSYQKKVGLDDMKNKLATAMVEKEKDTNDIVKYKKVIKKLEEVEATKKPVEAKVMVDSETQPNAKRDHRDNEAEAFRINAALTKDRAKRIANAHDIHPVTDKRMYIITQLDREIEDHNKEPEAIRRKVLLKEIEETGRTDIQKQRDPYVPHPDITHRPETGRYMDGDGATKSQNELDTINIGKDGMNTTQIESFLDKRTHHFIPCIARDDMDTLLPYVNKGTKEFGFVFNSQNKNQSGQHWRACYINKDSGECDFFDSLVSEPDTVFMKGITKLIEKIEPDIYLKFKINRVKLQSNTSSNCGEFCCQFLDKMFHGGKFRQATFYDSINGEKSVKKYRSKWGLL